MRVFYVFFITMLLISCATSTPKQPEEHRYDMMAPGIHQEVEPYVQQFIDLSKGISEWDDYKHVFIGFKDFPDNTTTVGTCWTVPVIEDILDPNGIYWSREIWLDKPWWDSHTQLEKEELVFHELGHCMLFRPHTELSKATGLMGWIERMLFKIGIAERKGYLKDGCPSSYMHPTILSESCISNHYEYYNDELFNFIEEEVVEEVVEESFYYRTL